MITRDISTLTRRGVLASGAAFALAGCGDLFNLKGLVGPPPAPDIYVLRARLPAAAGAPVRWQLAVAIPDAPAGLDTTRIPLMPTPTKMDYYANASWSDRTSLLVQESLIECLEATHRVSAARDTTGLNADYILQTDIRDFQAVYDVPPPPPPPPDSKEAKDPNAAPPPPTPPPHIVIQMGARLLAMPDRKIIGTFAGTGRADARTNSLDAIVAAFNDALTAVMAQIVDFTLKTPPASL